VRWPRGLAATLLERRPDPPSLAIEAAAAQWIDDLNMDWPTTTRFQINSGVHIVGDVDEGTFVRVGRSYARLDGPMGKLLRTLSEPRTLGSLVAPPHAWFTNAQLRWQIGQLVDAGYVAAEPGEGIGLGDGSQRPARSVPRAMSGATQASSRESIERAARAVIECAGARATPVCFDHYLAPRGLATLLDAAPTDAPAGWLPIAVFEAEVWLGPILGFAMGPCPQCLLSRLWPNHPVERFLTARGVASEQLFARAQVRSAMLDRALAWLQRRLPRVLSAGAPGAGAPGSTILHRVDFSSGRESQHLVQRRPQCPRCGDAEVVQRQMLEPPRFRAHASNAVGALVSSVLSRDGGLRSVDPELTYRRLASQVDPLVGRVGSLGPVVEKSNAHHQVFSGAYHRVPLPSDDLGMHDFSVLSAGKGRSPVQARTSALCEALERQCAQREGDEARRSARYDELAPDAVDPRELMLFSDAQYRAGTPVQQRLQRSPRSQQVPAPFDTRELLEWSPVWTLHGARLRWVPTQYCLDGSVVGSRQQPACCRWDSNGCAAGNTLAEATLQGLLEVVERDAIAVWWYNRISMPALSLDGLSSTASRLIERHERIERKCWALDLTHDLGIPVAAVLLEAPQAGGFALGFGCHLDADIALERAVLELEQVLDGDEEPRLFRRAELEHDRFLLADTGRARASHIDDASRDRTSAGGAEIEAALEACVHQLRARGLEPLLFDYSRPDVALHTVKVLVPGLRHFWPRYAPGRLYQVPIDMGWSTRPLSEAELNPLPLLM
jgi:oxazoline/thiazoline synthase